MFCAVEMHSTKSRKLFKQVCDSRTVGVDCYHGDTGVGRVLLCATSRLDDEPTRRRVAGPSVGYWGSTPILCHLVFSLLYDGPCKNCS
jgi:hypothetical protein